MHRQRGATMRLTQDLKAIVTTQPIRKLTTVKACTHSRLIDDELSASGERTGKVRCLECLAVIDDPHQSRQSRHRAGSEHVGRSGVHA
jgi:hypothetical protein